MMNFSIPKIDSIIESMDERITLIVLDQLRHIFCLNLQ